MTWGESLSFLEALPVTPKALQDRPAPLWPELWPYYQAFCALSASRNIGMAAGPIPASEILAYALIHGIGDAAELFRLVTVCDRIWLNNEARRAPPAS